MKRTCSIDNETLFVVLNNERKFLHDRNTIYIEDVRVLLEKALEGVEDKKDLSPSEQSAIKSIRHMIKGL